MAARRGVRERTLHVPDRIALRALLSRLGGEQDHLARLSLEAVHYRGWGSLYAALSKGGLDEGAPRDLLAHRSSASDGAEPPV